MGRRLQIFKGRMERESLHTLSDDAWLFYQRSLEVIERRDWCRCCETPSDGIETARNESLDFDACRNHAA